MTSVGGKIGLGNVLPPGRLLGENIQCALTCAHE